MRRREFSAACACCLSGLAGCTAIDDLGGLGSRDHPFADSTLGVRIENRGETDHDIKANGREALEFWRTEHSQYLDFSVDFEVVEERPDIVLAYVDTPEACSEVENYSESVLGCAPWIQAGHRISRPVTAYVVAADRPYGSVRTTAKHELGHVLGLGHDDEPREIMSNRPEDRIRLFAVRIEIWEAALEAHTQYIAAVDRLNDGIGSWNDEQFSTAIETFEQSRERFEATADSLQTANDRSDELDADPPLETVDFERLTDDLGRRREQADRGIDLTTELKTASRAARDGESTRQAIEEANRLLSAFQSAGWEELRTVAVALGLVRGFERDDDEVDVETDL